MIGEINGFGEVDFYKLTKPYHQRAYCLLDSITKATLKGKNKLSGINQAFGDKEEGSKTASATAFRLDTDSCCNGVSDPDELGTDCGGPCGDCPQAP